MLDFPIMNRIRQKLAESGVSTLAGVAVQRYDPGFVEIAAHLGFHAVWIEMEHESLTLEHAADLCRVAAGAGLLAMIRVPGPAREPVLKAAELGPDILDLPMANTPEIASEFVRNARFPPLGSRGFFGSSRAMRYGLGASPREHQLRINEELALLVQVETREAVACAAQLCATPGIDGIFLGPGDLSSSFGVTGETEHPLVRQAMLEAAGAARRHGKLLAGACGPGEFRYWSEQGASLLFCASNLSCQIAGGSAVLEKIGIAPRA
jgi:2-keto-3-deoxy-L-rhamnonate aldolase RhmA